MPRKAIRLTGSKPSSIPLLDPSSAAKLIKDGRVDDALYQFSAFSSWSPIVRQRAAIALAKQKDVAVEPFIQLLDAPSLEARLGACEALQYLRGRAAPAVPKLIETLKANDMWLRVQAAEALNAIGKPAMNAVPTLLQMVAKSPTAEDPRGMEQRFISHAIFSRRGGILGHSLDGVDRDQLLEAVKAGLRNEDGHARGSFANVYKNLSFDELRPILPAIHRAIVEPAPSGIMFDGPIQSAGL
ncbi:MAG: HEAT repeat domain-containing protein [Akkermansiaceae bacterium]